jgi:hypothetical protein
MRPLVAALFAIIACSPTTAHCGTPSPPLADSGKFDDDAWKRFMEQQMRRQLAGEKPPVEVPTTWKDYWATWYHQIRISPGLPWPGSKFKTKNDMIRYIKARLKAHRLSEDE